MAYKFKGTISMLKNIVKATGIQGEWRINGNMYTFRSLEGGVLNWWSNGTVNFQGNAHAKIILERLLKKNFAIKTAKLEYDLDDADITEPFVPHRHNDNAEASCNDSKLLLLSIKSSLEASKFVVTKLNNSTYVVRESSNNISCYLVREGAEVYIQARDAQDWVYTGNPNGTRDEEDPF